MAGGRGNAPRSRGAKQADQDAETSSDSDAADYSEANYGSVGRVDMPEAQDDPPSSEATPLLSSSNSARSPSSPLVAEHLVDAQDSLGAAKQRLWHSMHPEDKSGFKKGSPPKIGAAGPGGSNGMYTNT